MNGDARVRGALAGDAALLAVDGRGVPHALGVRGPLAGDATVPGVAGRGVLLATGDDVNGRLLGTDDVRLSDATTVKPVNNKYISIVPVLSQQTTTSQSDYMKFTISNECPKQKNNKKYTCVSNIQ